MKFYENNRKEFIENVEIPRCTILFLSTSSSRWKKWLDCQKQENKKKKNGWTRRGKNADTSWTRASLEIGRYGLMLQKELHGGARGEGSERSW